MITGWQGSISSIYLFGKLVLECGNNFFNLTNFLTIIKHLNAQNLFLTPYLIKKTGADKPATVILDEKLRKKISTYLYGIKA
jgi:hypothetical protein